VIRLLPNGSAALVALNKIDRLADQDALLPQMAELAELLPVRGDRPGQRGKRSRARCATQGSPRPSALSDPIFAQDEITDRDERFLGGRVHPREDLPAARGGGAVRSTVAIDRFEHRGALRRIHATIHVDSGESAAILLGEGANG
jgi:GTP-binding protein Era